MSRPATAPRRRAAPAYLSPARLTDDHLRLLERSTADPRPVGEAVGVPAPGPAKINRDLSDAAWTALSWRRLDVDERDWFAARRRCADAWNERASAAEGDDLGQALARTIVDRLVSELLDLPGGADPSASLAAYVAHDPASGGWRIVGLARDTAHGERILRVVRDPGERNPDLIDRVTRALSALSGASPLTP